MTQIPESVRTFGEAVRWARDVDRAARRSRPARFALPAHGAHVMKRLLLRLILGERTYRYMCNTLAQDRRLPVAHTVDIIVRSDGKERRVEADWLKPLCKIVKKDLPAPVGQS